MKLAAPPAGWQLNRRGLAVADAMVARAFDLKIEQSWHEGMARVVDCGVAAPGGLEAGRLLAEVCLGGLGQVAIGAGDASLWSGPWVSTTTDHPVPACMGSQYAGWQIAVEKYFAMGSGPMRAAGSREPLFDEIGCRETYPAVVGVLEGKLPTPEACSTIADACHVPPGNVTLMAARTKSVAGTVQVVARSVETALHKLHELKFPIEAIRCGFGTAPLPPPAKDDLGSIGRTNDAILYGATVTLWIDGEGAGDLIAELGPKVPSSASSDYGQPFGDVFAKAGHDFYKIDAALFSPAVVRFFDLRTGRAWKFGEVNGEVVGKSFG